MKIEFINLREIKMRLRSPFETSFGVTQDRRIVLVEVKADGVTGWGEITTDETPSYNPETTQTAWHIISDFIAPSLIGKNLAAASDFPELTEGIRGHHMAKAGVENALWDIEAQQRGVPLWKLLGGTLEQIACGVSLGIRKNPQSLIKKVEEELKSGYQRIKLKIKPGKDLVFVAAVRKQFPDIRLSVDANSAYRLEDAPHLKELDEFNLLMIEQPLYWDDIHSHAKLQSQIKTAICLDECIHNARHAAAAIELGAPAGLLTSNWGALEDTVRLAAYKMFAANNQCRRGAAECWKAVLDVRTTLRCPRCLDSRCQETSRPVTVMGMRTSLIPR
jgi:O-succinylbenzoate synthase